MKNPAKRSLYACACIAAIGTAMWALHTWEFPESGGSDSPESEASEIPPHPKRSGQADRKNDGANAVRIGFLTGFETNLDDLPAEGFPPGLQQALRDLVSSGDYNGALAMVMEEAQSDWVAFGIEKICVLWATVDKDACLEALLGLDGKAEIVDAGLRGLFIGRSVDTSPENITWVKAMVVGTSNVEGYKHRLSSLGGAWVVCGVLPVRDFVELWNDATSARAKKGISEDDDPYETAFRSLASFAGGAAGLNVILETPGMADGERLKGLTRAELGDLRMALSAEFERAIRSPGYDAIDRSLGASQLAEALGRMAGNLDGILSSLDDYECPRDQSVQNDFLKGLGARLGENPPSAVAKLIRGEDPRGLELWTGYVESRLSILGQSGLLGEIEGLDLPDTYLSGAGGMIATEMLRQDSLAASKFIAAAPEGEAKQGMIAVLVRYLRRAGDNASASEWEALLTR